MVSPTLIRGSWTSAAVRSVVTDTRCRDCGAETFSAEPGVPIEWYDVHDHVWAAAGMAPYGGCLCIGCLEVALAASHGAATSLTLSSTT